MATTVPTAPRRRRLRWLIGLGVPVVAVAVLIAVWSWDWFIPLAERQASAALGRKVTIGHLHVALGRTTTVTLTDLRIDNPEGFAAEPPFAAVPRLTVQLDAMAYIRDRAIIIPTIEIDRPALLVAETAEGRNNYTLALGSDPAGETPPENRVAPPRIGQLRIIAGTAKVVIPRLRADFENTIETQHPEGRDPGIVVQGRGTYAARPVTLTLTGGALLNLRDENNPWPMDLQIANGPVRVHLAGTLRDPLDLAGADLRLELTGPDMALLTPWTGVPLPQTTPFSLAGRVDYTERRIRFQDIQGRLGRTDLAGIITVLPGGAEGRERPDVTADLRSRRVDLDDLAGFIGSTPGNAATPGQTPQQRAAVARANASTRLLPTQPVNVPRLLGADVHLKYRGERLENAAPLERLDIDMDIVAGNIHLHPIRFGIGQGGIEGDVRLTPAEDGSFRAQATADLRRIDVSRLMAPTGFRGQGILGGVARLDSRGRSLAELMGRGDGELAVVVVGGDLSALLVDLSGLQLGRAALSLLGIPTRTQLRCFIAEFGLQRGVLVSRSIVVDTDSSIINGEGRVDLARERLDLRIRSESKRFSVGALPTSIGITGSFKDPSIGPDLGELALRGGAAAGLTILGGPLGLLPTMQFGADDNAACTQLQQRRPGQPQPPRR